MIMSIYRFFKEKFLLIFYIFKYPERCIKKSCVIKKKFVYPYEQLIKIHSILPQKKFFFQIKANTEALKIRFCFSEDYSNKSDNFIEKVYYSKNCNFTVKEKFNQKIKILLIYNQVSSNIFNLELRITFKNLFLNIFYFNKEEEIKQKKLSMNTCIIIPAFGKTASTTVLRSIANLKIPTAKYEKFGEIFKKISFKNASFINKYEGVPYNKLSINKISNFKRSMDKIGAIDYLNVSNNFESVYKRKIYIIIFRNIFDGYLSANFHTLGTKYVRQNFSKKKLINLLDKKELSYYKRYNNWIRLLLKNYKLNLKKFKKKKYFYYYKFKNCEFYLLNLNDLNNFFDFLSKKILKKRIKIYKYNVGKTKEYSKLYSSIKKIYKHQNINIKNLIYLKEIQKMLKI